MDRHIQQKQPVFYKRLFMATYFLSKYVDHLICLNTNEDCIRKVREMMEEIPPQEPTYERYGTFEAEVLEVILKNEKKEETSRFISGERVSTRVKIEFHENIEEPIVGFTCGGTKGVTPSISME